MTTQATGVVSTYRAFLVEEDAQIAQQIVAPLRNVGMTVEHFSDVASGFQAFKQREPHIVLLSLGLPRVGGVVLCPEIRKISMVPITILSQRTRNEDHLHALNLGADDFVTVRVFDEHLMMARILTLLRRVYQYDLQSQARAQPPQVAARNRETLIMKAPANPTPTDWVTCESCAYMGPAHRFDKLDALGQKAAICPHCNQAQHLRFSLG